MAGCGTDVSLPLLWGLAFKNPSSAPQPPICWSVEIFAKADMTHILVQAKASIAFPNTK